LKKLIGLWILLLCSIHAPVFAEGEIGEHIKFGDYRGADVSYRILAREDINQDGVLDYALVSDSILMYKPVDATTNIWKNTALRQWLNSSEEQVSWNGTPPAIGAVSCNPYDKEAGFLSDTNMNAYERSLILPVTHKSMYPKAAGADGGSEVWQWNDGKNKDYRLALQNYDDAYYQMTTDRVFIPSVKELIELSVPMLATATPQAGTNLSSSKHGFQLRDATSGKTNHIRYFYEYNNISTTSVSSGVIGIRTMLYLDGTVSLAGNGTLESPYYIYGGRDGGGVVIKKSTITQKGEETVYTLQLKNRIMADAQGQLMVALYDEENRLEKLYRSQEQMTSGRGKTISLTVPKNDIAQTKAFFWDGKLTPLTVHEAEPTEEGDFTYKQNLFMENPDIRISNVGNYVISNAFDGNAKTVFAISSLHKSEMIFSFLYPANITSVSLQSFKNGDWATVKTYELLVYNDEQVYRKKSGTPKCVGTITLSNSTGMQTFDLSDVEGLENVTHLIFKPVEIYKTSTGATWGGFSEIRISGTQDKNEILVEKTTEPKLSENTALLNELGIVLSDGEQSIQTVTKIMQDFGFAFPDNDSDAPMSAELFYHQLAESGGYIWQEFLELGIWSLLGDEAFSKEDVGIAVCEALMMPDALSQKPMLERLYEAGMLSEMVYTRLLDKLDAYTPAHLEDYVIPSGASTDTTFTFSKPEKPKVIPTTNFSYNMPFHYLGGHLGTLPLSNSQSKRVEFAKALKEAGAKSLRFPGGLCSHQYFMEGEEYVRKLSAELQKWSGFYNVYNSNNNTCIDFYDFLDFCSEQGIEPIFQVNTSFYVEPTEDKIYAITKNSYVAGTDGVAVADYYDRDRIAEAAEALGKQIDKMLSAGYSIKYWELGNEDFATINYLKTDLSNADNPATDNYVAISAAFARVIKEKIPDAVLIATEGFPNLSEKYQSAGVYELMDYVSAHYPFANWSTPASADRGNLTKLLLMNEQEFSTNAGVPAEENYEGKKMVPCTTETSTWKFECWEGNVIQNTYAMALNTAHQWGELVFETPWKISTLHDLESPYFGFVQYNRKFNPQSRHFVYRNTTMRIGLADIPEDYTFFDKYLVNPAGRAVELLSRHCGGAVLKSAETSAYRQISAFASEADGKVQLTVVNKTDRTQAVDIAFSDINFPKQTLHGEVMFSETPAAMLPREYTQEECAMALEAGNRLQFSAKPYSIYHFVLCE